MMVYQEMKEALMQICVSIRTSVTLSCHNKAVTVLMVYSISPIFQVPSYMIRNTPSSWNINLALQ